MDEDLLTDIRDLGLAGAPRLGGASHTAANHLLNAVANSSAVTAPGYRAEAFIAAANVAALRGDNASVRMVDAYDEEDYMTAVNEARQVKVFAAFSARFTELAVNDASHPTVGSGPRSQASQAEARNDAAQAGARLADTVIKKSSERIHGATDAQLAAAETPRRWRDAMARTGGAERSLFYAELHGVSTGIGGVHGAGAREVYERRQQRDLTHAALFEAKFG